MPNFTFTARDADGQWHRGTQIAESPSALAGAIRARGLWLAAAQPAEEEIPDSPRHRRGILAPGGIDVELGLRMLANMLESGLTLLSSLKTCGDQARRARMAAIWYDVHDRIAGGIPLAESLARHPRCFPKLVIQLVRAGEISGNLEVVLDRAAEQLEQRRRNLIVTLLSGLMYPAITIFVALAVTAYLLISVIPQISTFLLGQRKKLPAITQALIDCSNFVNSYLWIIAIAIAALIAGVILSRKWPPAALVIDRMILRVPLFGKLFRLAGTAMFARGLGMLLDAGVPMLAALETSGSLMKNHAIAHRVEQSRQAVLGGSVLARQLAAGREFMPMLPRMVAVGEETGTLGRVLFKVADFHEHQLQTLIKRMMVLIEPIMTLVVGFIVGFVYLAFFMAVYTAATG